MSSPILSDAVADVVARVGPRPNEVQESMQEYAAQHGFPIIGPAAGRFLAVLSRLIAPRTVIELGSGFGYSASWFLNALDPDDAIILTEYDEDLLDVARDFFGELDALDRARFVAGDAIETQAGYEGPFDVVLFDHEKARYTEAFEALQGRIATPGLVVADNIMHGPVTLESVRAALSDDQSLSDTDDQTRGIAEYLRCVSNHPDYRTVIVPLGNGLAVTTKA